MVRQAEVSEKSLRQGALRMEYDPEVDILTVYLRDPETALSRSREVESGVILNYAEDGALSSVELLDAARRYPPGQLAAHSIDELIDLKSASRISGIAPVTLRTQAERGRLWALRLAGQWLTTRERLQQYMDSRALGRKARPSSR